MEDIFKLIIIALDALVICTTDVTTVKVFGVIGIICLAISLVFK